MRLILLAVVASLLASPALAEKIYRWTDANGQVHFSSQPPRDNPKAQSITVTGQPSLGGDGGETSAQSDEKTTAKTAAEGAAKEDKAELSSSIDAKQAQENCRIATEQKQQINQNTSRRYQQKDGSYRPLTDAERADQNAKMDAVIKKFCI